jgi:hypothetical protein
MAFPGVLASRKNVPWGPELDKVGLFEELLTIPVPVRRCDQPAPG